MAILQRMMTVADVSMDELCTSRNIIACNLLFLGVLCIVLLSSNALYLETGVEVTVNCAELSSDRVYFGSLCAVIAACMAPMLDLVLEFINIYWAGRQDKKDQEDSPFNNFIVERCVVLLVILVPSVVLVTLTYFQSGSNSENLCNSALLVVFLQNIMIGNLIIALQRELNPTIFTWRSTLLLCGLFNISITYRRLVGVDTFYMFVSVMSAAYMVYLYFSIVRDRYTDDGSDLLTSFNKKAAFWYSTFGMVYYILNRIVISPILSEDFGLMMCNRNFAKVAFITVFFVMGSPKRLGMDLFVLKAS